MKKKKRKKKRLQKTFIEMNYFVPGCITTINFRCVAHFYCGNFMQQHDLLPKNFL